MELDSSSIERWALSAFTAGDVSIRQKKSRGHTDVLSRVEAVGWRLEHVNHVYVMTGQISRDKFLSSGQEVGVMGRVVGYYLFRRDSSQRDTEYGAAGHPESPV